VRRDPEVQMAVNQYQLGLPRMPVSGHAGELLGRGAGSSLEFQEYREYMPGDDIRHLDWAAYARSDTLMIRLYREEISPRSEILLDASLSMTTGGAAKSLVARQLAGMFSMLSGQLGGRPRIVPIDDSRPLARLGLDDLERLGPMPFSGKRTMNELVTENLIPLSRQAVRIVISDFLFPHDPAALVKKLAADASAIWIIQLLNEWEADPTPIGGRRLVDVETAAETDLLLDRNTVSQYRGRLGRVQEELAQACRRAHGRFAKLVADRGLTALCRSELCAADMLRPV